MRTAVRSHQHRKPLRTRHMVAGKEHGFAQLALAGVDERDLRAEAGVHLVAGQLMALAVCDDEDLHSVGVQPTSYDRPGTGGHGAGGHRVPFRPRAGGHSPAPGARAAAVRVRPAPPAVLARGATSPSQPIQPSCTWVDSAEALTRTPESATSTTARPGRPAGASGGPAGATRRR